LTLVKWQYRLEQGGIDFGLSSTTRRQRDVTNHDEY